MPDEKDWLDDARIEITQRAIERADAQAYKFIFTLIGSCIAGTCLWVIVYWLSGGFQ